MKYIMYLLGFVFGIAAVGLGLYVSVYLCLYGGIMQIIDGIQHTPAIGKDIAIGIIRILLTSAAGGLTFAVCVFIAAGFFGMSNVFSATRRY